MLMPATVCPTQYDLLALMRSAVLMLGHLGMQEENERLAAALHQIVVVEKIRTRDLGGEASTQQFTEAVVRAIESDGG